MKSPKFHFVAGAVFMVLLMVGFNHAGSAQQHPGVPIGAGPINFSGEHLKAGGFELSAFVETGSTSLNCLCTLRESNFAVFGTVLFCAPRGFEGKDGVFVHVFFPFPAPANLIHQITLYQEGAKGYGSPVLFPGP